MAKKNKSKRFKKLNASRTRNRYDVNWNKGEKYFKQVIRWNVITNKGTEKYVEKDVGPNEQKDKIFIDESKYYPNKNSDGSYKPCIKKIKIKGRGRAYKNEKKKTKKKWSPWRSRPKTVKPPYKPFVEIKEIEGEPYSTQVDVTLYGSFSDNAKQWATAVEIQTAYVVNDQSMTYSQVPDGLWSDVSPSMIYNNASREYGDLKIYSKANKNTDGWTLNFAEPGYTIDYINNGQPVTRFIRARLVGPAGPSGWRPAKRTFGDPNAAFDVKPVITDNGEGYTVSVMWKYYDSDSIPVKSMQVQYCFAAPTEEGEPRNPSPTLGTTVAPFKRNNLGGKDSEDQQIIELLADESTKTFWSTQFHDWDEEYNTKVPYMVGGGRFYVDQKMEDNFLWVRVDIISVSGDVAAGEWTKATYANGSMPNGLIKPPTIVSVTQQEEGENNALEIELTNNSEIEGSFVVVQYISASFTYDIGIMTEKSDSITVGYPRNLGTEWEIGAYAATGSYSEPTVHTYTITEDDETYEEEYDTYVVTPVLKSEVVTQKSGKLPAPPANIKIRNITPVNAESGKVDVTWDWTWRDANRTDISWSKDEDAWHSTSGYSSYPVYPHQGNHWVIPDLELGEKYYFRLRHVHMNSATSGDGTNSVWSKMYDVDLRSAPSTSKAQFSPSYIVAGGTTTLSWVYLTTDNSTQKQVIIAFCDEDGNLEVPERQITLGTDEPYTKQVYQFDTSKDESFPWEPGHRYAVRIKLVSTNDSVSDDWSDPVFINVVEPVECSIDTTRDDYPFIPDPEDDASPLLLRELPMSIKVNGAKENQITDIHIERTESCDDDLPDDTNVGGYEGEIIWSYSQTGDALITMTRENLVGFDRLNDQAEYKLVATVRDNYGQVSDPVEINFKVSWAVQALMPKASVVSDPENLTVEITIDYPDDGTPAEGDYCEIYRLSADHIELIATDCQFGVSYTDPHPTLGTFGGHRIVYRTANGDYNTADGFNAWLDIVTEPFDPEVGYEYGDFAYYNYKVYKCINPDYDADYWRSSDWEPAGVNCDFVDSHENVIDFGKGQVRVMFNSDYNSNWSKDFQETKYLGGSVEGDWNPTVSRTGSLNTSVVATDAATIRDLRELAMYAGPCHVRTKDGSNYTADVQVSEAFSYSPGLVRTYTLNFTRVDPPGLDVKNDAAEETEEEEETNP